MPRGIQWAGHTTQQCKGIAQRGVGWLGKWGCWSKGSLHSHPLCKALGCSGVEWMSDFGIQLSVRGQLCFPKRSPGIHDLVLFFCPVKSLLTSERLHHRYFYIQGLETKPDGSIRQAHNWVPLSSSFLGTGFYTRNTVNRKETTFMSSWRL